MDKDAAFKKAAIADRRLFWYFKNRSISVSLIDWPLKNLRHQKAKKNFPQLGEEDMPTDVWDAVPKLEECMDVSHLNCKNPLLFLKASNFMIL